MLPAASTPAGSRPTSIDSHFHVFGAGMAQPGARYGPGYDARLADWQAAAGACGIDGGVLVQPSFLGIDNSLLCTDLRAHPGSLRGIAVVAPDCSTAHLHELHVCGVRGIRLNLAGVSHDLCDWPCGAAFWDDLLALGWHVELHTDLGALPGVLAQLPAALPLVVDHMAKPAAASATDPTLAALQARARTGRVHVKLSGAYRLHGRDPRAVAQALLAALGDHSLLWGSDWPCTNHEDCADYPVLRRALEAWIGERAAAAALGRNALALYWGEVVAP